MKKIKRFIFIIFALLLGFIAYVFIANRNNTNMTFRQKLLKTIYPAFMWVTKKAGTNSTILSNNNKKAMQSFYTLTDTLNNGNTFSFENLKGKKVLLVNTASDCGYTNQYNDLQKLSEQYKDKLIVLGFPANDFKEQEKGNDDEIAQFCKVNFGVTFPLMKKSSVISGNSQNNVFKWLSSETLNGWCNQQPTWNFSKYLVNENGELINYFDPSISPMDKEIINAIK